MANQAKPLRGATPSRRSKVPSGGRGWFTNRVMAHVRTPGGPTSPTQRLFRDARSSPNLCARPSLTRSNRRGTGPVCPVVWEGWRREASPYPDQLRVAVVRRLGLEPPQSTRSDHRGLRPYVRFGETARPRRMAIMGAGRIFLERPGIVHGSERNGRLPDWRANRAHPRSEHFCAGCSGRRSWRRTLHVKLCRFSGTTF